MDSNFINLIDTIETVDTLMVITGLVNNTTYDCRAKAFTSEDTDTYW